MIEFEQISSSEAARPIYQAVVSKIDIENHPDFSIRPIKVLDLGGGSGTVGQAIKQQCEAFFGPMSQAEFGSLVDYVNIDLDSTALTKSPGRTVNHSLTDSYNILEADIPFDFVLCVNPVRPTIPYSFEELTRGNVPAEIKRGITNASSQIAGRFSRVILLNAALMLGEGGKYIQSGFMDKSTFEGILLYIKSARLGLTLDNSQIIELDDCLKDLFVGVDTNKKPGSRSFEKLKEMYGQYRIITTRMKGTQDRERLVDILDKEFQAGSKLMSFLEVQDRFGSW